MPNWNIARESHSIEELETIVSDAKGELEDALWRGGEGSREHTEAVHVLRIYTRRLDDAKEKQERRERDEKRDPVEIVDKVMGER